MKSKFCVRFKANKSDESDKNDQKASELINILKYKDNSLIPLFSEAFNLDDELGC